MKITAIFSLLFIGTEVKRFFPYLYATTALNFSKANAANWWCTDENSVPFDITKGYSYRKITDRKTLNASGTFPPGFSSRDMITYVAPVNTIPNLYSNAAQYIFIPFDTGAGGLLRHNTVDGSILILAQGNASIPHNFDPATFDVTKGNFVTVDPIVIYAF